MTFECRLDCFVSLVVPSVEIEFTSIFITEAQKGSQGNKQKYLALYLSINILKELFLILFNPTIFNPNKKLLHPLMKHKEDQFLQNQIIARHDIL